jgi:hypothetical protein
MLTRLATLLEQLGDLSLNLPDLGLPSLNLNLPGASLPCESAVLNACALNVLNHPYMRLGGLQVQMNAFVQRLTGGFGAGTSASLPGGGLNLALCNSASGASGAQASAADSNTIAVYTQNFITNGGNVLTASQQAKYAQAQTALAALQALGSNVGKNYAYYTSGTVASAGTGNVREIYYPSPPFGQNQYVYTSSTTPT